MIHSARSTVSPVSWALCCFDRFWKVGTDGRTDGQHVQKQWSLPAVTMGRPVGSIETYLSSIFVLGIKPRYQLFELLNVRIEPLLLTFIWHCSCTCVSGSYFFFPKRCSLVECRAKTETWKDCFFSFVISAEKKKKKNQADPKKWEGEGIEKDFVSEDGKEKSSEFSDPQGSDSFIDPLGQPKVTAGRDHCFRTCCPYVRTSPLFKSRKTKQQRTMARLWAWPSGSLMTPILFFLERTNVQTYGRTDACVKPMTTSKGKEILKRVINDPLGYGPYSDQQWIFVLYSWIWEYRTYQRTDMFEYSGHWLAEWIN